MSASSGSTLREAKRIGKFGVVGVINTIIDFAVLNFLHFHLGWAFIPANLVSTTIAMIFSFIANRHIVFGPHGGTLAQQIVKFWVVTAFGVYVLQTAVIWLLTYPLTGVANFGVDLIQAIGLARVPVGVLLTNSVKLLATVVSLTWNYLAYRKWVFAS